MVTPIQALAVWSLPERMRLFGGNQLPSRTPSFFTPFTRRIPVSAFHGMPRAAESLRAATGVAQGAGARETRTEVQRRQGGISVQNPHPIFEKWEVLPHVERKR